MYYPDDVTMIEADDELCRRYLKHKRREGLDGALEMAKKSLRWRKEFGVRELNEYNIFQLYLNVGCFIPFKKDKEGLPCIIFRTKLHRKNVARSEDMKRYIIFWVEYFLYVRKNSRLSFVFDCTGASYSCTDFDQVKFIIQIFNEFYPWALGNVIVYNMSWLFTTVWAGIRALIPADGADRFKFCHGAEIYELIDRDNLPEFMGGRVPTPFRELTLEEIEAVPTDPEIEKIIFTTPAIEKFYQQNFGLFTKSPRTFDGSNHDSIFVCSPDDTLTFEACGNSRIASLTLTNTSSDARPIAFKMSTNRPDAYTADPREGIVRPGETIRITISIKRGGRTDSDKVLLQVIPMDDRQKNIKDLFKFSNRNLIEQKLIRCGIDEGEESDSAIAGSEASRRSSTGSTSVDRTLTELIALTDRQHRAIIGLYSLLVLCVAVIVKLLISNSGTKTLSAILDDDQDFKAEEPKGRKKTRKKLNSIIAFQAEAKATAILLFDYYKRFRGLNVNCTPRQYFCKEQVLKWVFNIMSCIKSGTLTDVLGREMFINLYNLFVANSVVDVTVTRYFYHLLALLHASFGELQSLLESTGCKQIDYTVLLEHLGAMIRFAKLELPPGVEHFRPVRVLGAGAFGTCFKVQHVTTGKFYTLKVVPATAYPTMEHIVADRICATVVKHPMVVYYLACYPVARYHVSIMEYVAGIDLQKAMPIVEDFGVERTRLIAAQMVAGLQHMHYRGLMHRDVKPGNILLTSTGKIKIIDFDTAKMGLALSAKRFCNSFLERAAGEHRDKEVAGTFLYMAPEIHERRRYGRASDWWSLGVLLFRIVERRMPFYGKTEEEIRAAVLGSSVKFRKAARKGEEYENARDLISALLTKKPVERLGSTSLDEIITHKFFEDLDWNLLRKKRVFEIPLIHDLLKENSMSAQRTGNAKSDTVFEPEILYDQPINTSNMVLVFTSTSEQSAASKAPVLEITVDESHPCPRSTQSLKRSEAECLRVVYHTDWNLDLKFGIVRGEDSLTFPIIRKMAPTYSEVSMLVEGDILIKIDDQSVVCAPLRRVQALIAVPGHHILQVSSSNPFRVYGRILKCQPLLKTMRTFNALLVAPTCTAPKSRRRRSGRPSDEDFIAVRQVSTKPFRGRTFDLFFISGIRESVQANFFVGDLIVAVDGIDARRLSLESLQGLLRCYKGPVVLRLLPTSALRHDRLRFDRLFSAFADLA
ncbi:uncharacterized protein LOC100899234 [Galendromus occidentalis]|uniref:Serine/threonine-protein kinase greatwall n=1 Tax=Galendromus occidentalis TaxID=34638 RepID=A0AAJ7L7G4_9ACAR|nr:uncharacterized protein LOC100899234 [Galendromus occidentalis]